MRTFDLAPFYRSTVGFDRLFDLIDSAGTVNTAATYPPYNIERTGENDYRVTVAVAGFGAEDLEVEVRENVLTLRGRKSEEQKDKTFLHQGIAARAFERVFHLADHVQVTGADLENGVLHVVLHRVVPEEKRAKTIEIRTGKATTKPTLEHQAA
ncbi:MAG: Hsp20 family protein [Pseudomonadota bacterium]